MSEPECGEQNPYASPKTDAQLGHGEFQDNSDIILIDPWIPPRNAIDLLAGMGAELGLLWPLIVVTGILGGLTLGMTGMLAGVGLGGLLLLPAWLIDYILASRSTFTLPFFGTAHLSIHTLGIDFHRPLAKPKLVYWEQLLSIRPARPREVFMLGWVLWPLGRELTPTKSIHGHYRIEWTGGVSFFPPLDPRLFEHAIRRFQPRLLVAKES